MVQLENFMPRVPKSMIYKLKKSVYGLKQASRQWHYKFHQVVVSFNFETNTIEDCVYHKFSGSKYIFLILYIDDISLLPMKRKFCTKSRYFYQRNLR